MKVQSMDVYMEIRYRFTYPVQFYLIVKKFTQICSVINYIFTMIQKTHTPFKMIAICPPFTQDITKVHVKF